MSPCVNVFLPIKYFLACVLQFNYNFYFYFSTGIEYLCENNLLQMDAQDIAHFLYKGEGLNKTAIGKLNAFIEVTLFLFKKNPD